MISWHHHRRWFLCLADPTQKILYRDDAMLEHYGSLASGWGQPHLITGRFLLQIFLKHLLCSGNHSWSWEESGEEGHVAYPLRSVNGEQGQTRSLNFNLKPKRWLQSGIIKFGINHLLAGRGHQFNLERNRMNRIYVEKSSEETLFCPGEVQWM